MAISGKVTLMLVALALLGCKGVQPTSAASGTDGPNSGSSGDGASGPSSSGGATRVEYIKDETLNNMVAVEVKIPADWKFQGGLIQGSPCAEDPYTVWRATSPDGKSMYERMPVLGWKYGTAPVLNRPGANNGCLPMKGAISAVDFAKYMVNLLHVQPVEVRPFLEAAEAQLEQASAKTRWKAHGALAMVQFMNGSTKMKGVLRVVVRCQETVIPGFSAAQSATTIDRCESDMLFTTSPEGEYEKVMRQWSAPGMGNGQGNLDWQAASERRFEQNLHQWTQAYLDNSNKNSQAQQDSFRQAAAVHQQMHNEFMDAMQRGTDMSMQHTADAMNARSTATSDWVDYALDRQTVRDVNTGQTGKISNQVTPGGALQKVHGDGTP
jgi:hypothetical protein